MEKENAVLLCVTLAFAILVYSGLTDDVVLQWDGTLIIAERAGQDSVWTGQDMAINLTGARHIEIYTLLVVATTIGVYTLINEGLRGKGDTIELWLENIFHSFSGRLAYRLVRHGNPGEQRA